MKLCRLQEDCPQYKNSGREPPNHDIRNKIPCQKTLDYSCEMYVLIRNWYNEPIACNIEKVNKIRGKK